MKLLQGKHITFQKDNPCKGCGACSNAWIHYRHDNALCNHYKHSVLEKKLKKSIISPTKINIIYEEHQMGGIPYYLIITQQNTAPLILPNTICS
jgi:hypothetical protein